MPVKTKAAVLFARATHDKVSHLWPVAVFSDSADAKSYATLLRIAYRAGDAEAIALLDPSHRKDGDSKPLLDVKWSVATVPYAPKPVFSEDAATDE